MPFELIHAALAIANTVAEDTEIKKSFIDTLGVNWRIFIAQLVNFGLLLLVLWKWVYRPLLKIMRERSDKIEQGLIDAKEAATRLSATEEEIKNKIISAEKETQTIIDQAKYNAITLKNELLAAAKKDKENILAVARRRIVEEKEKMFQEVKTEIADLIVESLKKIISSGISRDIDRRFIDEEIAKYKK